MALQVVGAGLGRTGTHSLKLALEQLLDGRCYHMMEVFGRPDDMPVWAGAIEGDAPDWGTFLAEYDATVDWPAAAFWRELADANPGAIVLLSTRSSADAWWRSAHATIFEISRRPLPEDDDPALDPFRAQLAMVDAMFTKSFTPHWNDEAEAKAAYEAHNAAVRAAVPADRLVEWQPGDGWAPICERLGIAVPDEPFPHVNSTDDFRAMAKLDD
ncbi:MAG: sulfotransferase [Acidimicrobiia bacterium]